MLTLSTTVRAAGVGAILGCLGAVGILWAPEEPYKPWIIAAGSLNGIVTALLIATFVNGLSSTRATMLTGGACGLLTAAVVFLAKGGWQSWDAPYVIPTGLVEGIILGLMLRRLLLEKK